MTLACGMGTARGPAEEFGDTLAPYGIVFGRTVTFFGLTKKDLGLRCTVFIKKSSLPIPGRELHDYPEGMISTEGNWTVVNGEFNELGTHFLVLGWFTGPRSGYYFPIAGNDIDHIFLKDR
jgi:hypothetical protein